jgi:hypothetical protein
MVVVPSPLVMAMEKRDGPLFHVAHYKFNDKLKSKNQVLIERIRGGGVLSKTNVLRRGGTGGVGERRQQQQPKGDGTATMPEHIL